MRSRRNARVVTAFITAGLGLAASALVRRAGTGAQHVASREGFVADRRERMRVARLRLLAAPEDRAP